MSSPTAVVTASPLVRRFAGGILLVTVLLIGYGSLFPFEFVPSGRSLGDLLLGLSFRPTTRGDIVANLLLYLPLGVGLVLVLGERLGRLAVVLGAVAGGVLLSLGIELVQVHVPGRDSSFTDVVVNAIGTLVGASAGVVYARHVATPRRASVSARGSVDAVALGVVLLWLASRLAPFVPTIDWQKYKEALKPLIFDVQIGAPSVLGYSVAWLVVDYALCRWGKLANPRLGVLLAVAIVLAGRVVIVDTALSPAEIVAIAIGLPLAIGITALGARRQPVVLLALVVIAVGLQGLEPFTLGVRTPFGWLPFQSSISGDFEVGYSALFGKAFWCTSLIWLGLSAGWALLPAALVTAVLLAALEIAQMWLPGRSPEITDPLLALVVAVPIAFLAGRSPVRARGFEH